MFGLWTELGPLVLYKPTTKQSTQIPTPHYNPYTWSQIGSIFIFDQPAPVGFLYCNDAINATDCAGLSWTDELAAQNAHAALDAFYAKFACLQSLPLYLLGESYTGIYIPILARSLLEDSSQTYNLKGWAVGDGCPGTETGICGMSNGDLETDVWQVLFLAGHSQIPMTTIRNVMTACRKPNLSLDDSRDLAALWPTQSSDGSSACKEALKRMQQQVGVLFEYSIYDECTYDNGFLQGGVNNYPCSGINVMIDYLRFPEVKEALHVTNAYYYLTYNANSFDYTPTEKDLQPFY
jgi:carboxypeptidase C (cathepsin A)